MKIQIGLSVDNLVSANESDSSCVFPKINSNTQGWQKFTDTDTKFFCDWHTTYLAETKETSRWSPPGRLHRALTLNPCGSPGSPSTRRGRLCLNPLLGYSGENGGAWASFTLGGGNYQKGKLECN